MTNFHPRTLVLLARAGLAPVELEALNYPSRHQLPNNPKGFGLMGNPGTGKSWALTQSLAARVDRSVRRQQDPEKASLLWIDGEIARDERFLWVYWPQQANAIRQRRFENVWIENWAEGAEDVPLLVLDDIGREGYDNAKIDPARASLQRVVEFRHRFRRPVIWTCNLLRGEFVDFYGGPLTSRIMGTWPDSVMDGQDMRLFPVDEFKKAAGGDA